MKEPMETNSLISRKEFPAVSIVMPVQPDAVGKRSDRERLLTMIKTAEQKMQQRYSKIKAGQMVDKLHHVVNSINFSLPSESLAIYVSPGSERVIRLPYKVEERVVVDESFEIRDVLLAAKLRRHFLLVIISKNHVRTLFSDAGNFIVLNFENMPVNLSDVTTEHSYPGWDYLDTRAYEEKNIRNYIRFIDDVIQKEIRDSSYPVIVLADVRLNGIYRKLTSVPDRIADYIDGNFEHADSKELLNKVQPVLDRLMMEEQREALRFLEASVSSGQYAAGIAQVWRAAAEGRGRMLLVEKDYRQAARFGADTYTILLDDEVDNVRFKIEDAVDDILEMVLNYNGEIVFMENGDLKDYQRIALVNRY